MHLLAKSWITCWKQMDLYLFPFLRFSSSSQMLFFGQVRQTWNESFDTSNIVIFSIHDVLCCIQVNHQSFESSFTMKCEIDNHTCYLVWIYWGKKPFKMFLFHAVFLLSCFLEMCPKFWFICQVTLKIQMFSLLRSCTVWAILIQYLEVFYFHPSSIYFVW